MIANGAKNGTFQVDYLNDAVKEFGIRVKDETADDAFKTLGLNVCLLYTSPQKNSARSHAYEGG